MVALIAVDRCICILFSHPHVRERASKMLQRMQKRPQRRKRLTRATTVNLAVGCIILSSVAANLHIFWTQTNRGGGCRHLPDEYDYFLHYVRPKLDLMFAGVLPIIAVLVSSTLLLCAICCCFRRRRHTSVPVGDVSVDGGSSQCTRGAKPVSAVSKMSNRITWTLISIAICFVLCNVPARVYLALYPSLPSTARSDPGQFYAYRFSFSVLALLQFLTNVINFFIYSGGKQLFRKELRDSLLRICTACHR